MGLTVLLGIAASCVDRTHEQASDGSDGSDGSATVTETGTGHGDDTGSGSASDGACPPDALTCEFRGAWDVAVGHSKVYWIAGSASESCPAGAPCGTPRLLSIELQADAGPQSIELPDSPRVVVAVGPDDAAVIGTDSGVLLVEPGTAPRTIAPNRLTSLVVGGDDVFWADRDGPSIARRNWTTGWDQPPVPVFVSDGPAIEMLRIDGQTLAWTEYPSPGRGELRVLAPDDAAPSTIVEDVGLVIDLAIEAAVLYWVDAEGSLQIVPTTGTVPPSAARGIHRVSPAPTQIGSHTLKQQPSPVHSSTQASTQISPSPHPIETPSSSRQCTTPGSWSSNGTHCASQQSGLATSQPSAHGPSRQIWPSSQPSETPSSVIVHCTATGLSSIG